MSNLIYFFNINKFVYYLILLFPIAYISGPFMADLIISIVSVLFIFFLIKKKIFYIKILQLSLVFWLFIVASSFWAPNFDKAIISSTSYIRFLLFPFAVAYFIKDHDKFYFDLSRIIIVIICLIGCDVIFQNYTGRSISGYPSLNFRNSGFFGDELIAGGFITRIFFISLIFFILKKRNLLFFSYSIFVIFIVFLSGERMAFLLLLLGLFIIPLIFKSNKVKIIFFISLIIFIISIFALNEKNKIRMYDNFINVIKFGVYHDDGTYFKTEKNNLYIINSGWGAHWLAAKNIFIDSPMIGKGLRSFRFICNDKKYETISANDKNRCSTHPHNYHLEILSELGIVGYFLFVSIIFMYFKLIFKNNDNDHYLLIKFINLLILFWPIAITGSIFSNYFASIIWYILAISVFFNLRKYFKSSL